MVYKITQGSNMCSIYLVDLTCDCLRWLYYCSTTKQANLRKPYIPEDVGGFFSRCFSFSKRLSRIQLPCESIFRGVWTLNLPLCESPSFETNIASSPMKNSLSQKENEKTRSSIFQPSSFFQGLKSCSFQGGCFSHLSKLPSPWEFLFQKTNPWR